MSENQVKAWLATYCLDLEGRTNDEIELACTSYRQSHENRFMATSGALLHLMNERVQPARINGRVIDGRFQPYGGHCGCNRCVEKTPSQGFHRASKEVLDACDTHRREVEDWIAYQIERLPAVKPRESIEVYRKRCELDAPSRGKLFAERKGVSMTPELIAREEEVAAERLATLERRLYERHG